MLEDVVFGIEGQKDPRAVEIGRFHAVTSTDQHLCRFDAVGLNGDAGRNRADASKHLASNLPRIMTATPGIRAFCSRKVLANCIDSITIILRHEAFAKCFGDDENFPPNDQARLQHGDV